MAGKQGDNGLSPSLAYEAAESAELQGSAGSRQHSGSLIGTSNSKGIGLRLNGGLLARDRALTGTSRNPDAALLLAKGWEKGMLRRHNMV